MGLAGVLNNIYSNSFALGYLTFVKVNTNFIMQIKQTLYNHVFFVSFYGHFIIDVVQA